MTDAPDRTESVFAAAAVLFADERAAYLEQACAGDAALRGRVEALLRAHERAGHVLDRPAPGGREQTRLVGANEQAGTVVARRFKLLEEIGEGGMGTVWVAEQTEPVRRKVALKLIKAGMDSKNVIARFEAERQALALMDHPNVAKVLDGGLTEAGRPFFVMEYVKGVPITEYCDAARLSVPERLQLFTQVCQAVQHAHQKGIIHRDLKPSNILVAPYDDKPVPKIIDFGLAKAMHQSLTERTLHTAHETVLGTPLYMSPEQAQLNNLDIDTRSDLYSLGVLLYELLTGTTPLEKQRFKEAAWDEIRRVIREEDPPRPSTRLSSTNTLPSLAACRQTDPLKLPKLIRGELDWIVMKALEKDRSRRYETAAGMARDIERYLHDEPVEACPPRIAYRMKKFVRRNKGPVVAAGLIALALVIGMSIAALQAVRAGRAERVAIQERDRADAEEKLAQRNLFAAHMNLAHDAWQKGHVLRTRELLNQHVPAAGKDDLRSFEWRYLWQQANRQQSSLTVTPADGQAVVFAISPGGRWLAVGIIDGRAFKQRGDDYTLSEIKLWDLRTGMLHHTIVDPADDPQSAGMDKMYQELAFSADGRLFATVEFVNPMVWHGDEKSRYGSREMQSPRITIWDSETMTKRNSIPLAGFDVGDRIAFSPDGQQIAATYMSNEKPENALSRTIVAWNIPDRPDADQPAVGQAVFSRQVTMEPGYEFLVAFEFMPDSQSLAWRGGRGKPLTVAPLAGGEPDRTLPVPVHGLAFSPDGKFIAGSPYVWDSDTVRAGGWRTVNLFDAKSGEDVHAFPLPPMDNMFEPRAYFSPDSRTLAVRRGTTLHVWDIESKQQIGDLRGHTDNIRQVGFGADGRTIITVSNDKLTGNTVAKTWDIHTRPGPDEFSLGKGPRRKMWENSSEREHNVISGLDITPDGQALFTAWSSLPAGPETRVATLTDLNVGFRSAKTFPFAERTATIVELPADPKSNWVPDHAVCSRDGRRMAMTGRYQVQLWELAGGSANLTPTLTHEFPAPQYDTNRAPAVAFSPDGTQLVFAACREEDSSRQPDRLRLFDISSRRETEFPADAETWFEHQAGLTGVNWSGSCNGVVFSSDGRRIISVHKRYALPWETFIVVWDAATLQVLSVLESPRPMNYWWQPLALSRDDRLLATCQDDHSIFLWDVSEPEFRRVHDELQRRAAIKDKDTESKPTDAAAKPRVVMRGHSDLITAMTFHPDGKTLASAGIDRSIKLWDVITGELRLTLEGHAANIAALAFTPDGNTLISADNSGAVKIWRAAATKD